MMNKIQIKTATKYIQGAIILEFLVVFLTLVGIASLLGLIKLSFFIEIFRLFGVSICIAFFFTLIAGFFLGQYIDFSKRGRDENIVLGIIFLFFLLTFGLLVGTLSFGIFQLREIISISDFMYVILYFYLFGGIQTLIIGIGLGYKLNRIDDKNSKI